VKKEITPFIKIQGDETKKIIGKFEEDMKHFEKSLRTKSYNKYTTGIEKSMEVIEETRTKIKENEELLEKYTYYSEMFGFQDAVETSHNTIKNVNTYIVVIEKLWNQIQDTGMKLDKYKSSSWQDVNTDKMEDTIKQAKKLLTSNIKG
jgi:hypothetical protein